MRPALFALFALVASVPLVQPLSAGPLLFNVNLPVGSGSVIGTIETTGIIGAANILDWNLVISDGTNSFDLKGPASGNNSGGIFSTGMTETANGLDFSFTGGSYVEGFASPGIGSAPYLFFTTNVFWDGSATGVSLCVVNCSSGSNGSQNQFTAYSGNQQVASLSSVVPTPEPSTVGLVLTGLAAIRWRSRRR